MVNQYSIYLNLPRCWGFYRKSSSSSADAASADKEYVEIFITPRSQCGDDIIIVAVGIEKVGVLGVGRGLESEGEAEGGDLRLDDGELEEIVRVPRIPEAMFLIDVPAQRAS